MPPRWGSHGSRWSCVRAGCLWRRHTVGWDLYIQVLHRNRSRASCEGHHLERQTSILGCHGHLHHHHRLKWSLLMRRSWTGRGGASSSWGVDVVPLRWRRLCWCNTLVRWERGFSCGGRLWDIFRLFKLVHCVICRPILLVRNVDRFWRCGCHASRRSSSSRDQNRRGGLRCGSHVGALYAHPIKTAKFWSLQHTTPKATPEGKGEQRTVSEDYKPNVAESVFREEMSQPCDLPALWSLVIWVIPSQHFHFRMMGNNLYAQQVKAMTACLFPKILTCTHQTFCPPPKIAQFWGLCERSNQELPAGGGRGRKSLLQYVDEN